MTKTALGSLFFLVLAASLSAGCGDSGLTSPTGKCAYGGKIYAVGSSFPDQDGCNTCQCQSTGEVACTMMGCLSDAGLPQRDVRVSSDLPPDLAPDLAVDANTTPDVRADASCTLSTGMTFGSDGGLVIYQDEYSLDPKAGLSITRTYYGRASVDGPSVRTCTPPLPACDASSVVSLATIAADLAAADVQAAFQAGTTQSYGVDTRPMDGTMWSIALTSGGKVLVGTPCTSTSGACVAIPTGVKRLADDLRSLATAGAAAAECKGL